MVIKKTKKRNSMIWHHLFLIIFSPTSLFYFIVMAFLCLLIDKRIITGHKRKWQKSVHVAKNRIITQLSYNCRKVGKVMKYACEMHSYIFEASASFHLHLYMKDTVLQKQIVTLDMPAQLLGKLSLLKP